MKNEKSVPFYKLAISNKNISTEAAIPFAIEVDSILKQFIIVDWLPMFTGNYGSRCVLSMCRNLRAIVRVALLYKKLTSTKKLAERLEAQGIHTVFRKSKDGRFYGITYIDHITHLVFIGSSLGKQYSAKAVLESCVQNASYQEKQFQKTISISAENDQNFKSEEYSQNNTINVLLRTENENYYVPKQLKQKKKKGI